MLFLKKLDGIATRFKEIFTLRQGVFTAEREKNCAFPHQRGVQAGESGEDGQAELRPPVADGDRSDVALASAANVDEHLDKKLN